MANRKKWPQPRVVETLPDGSTITKDYYINEDGHRHGLLERFVLKDSAGHIVAIDHRADNLKVTYQTM